MRETFKTLYDNPRCYKTYGYAEPSLGGDVYTALRALGGGGRERVTVRVTSPLEECKVRYLLGLMIDSAEESVEIVSESFADRWWGEAFPFTGNALNANGEQGCVVTRQALARFVVESVNPSLSVYVLASREDVFNRFLSYAENRRGGEVAYRWLDDVSRRLERQRGLEFKLGCGLLVVDEKTAAVRCGARVDFFFGSVPKTGMNLLNCLRGLV